MLQAQLSKRATCRVIFICSVQEQPSAASWYSYYCTVLWCCTLNQLSSTVVPGSCSRNVPRLCAISYRNKWWCPVLQMYCTTVLSRLSVAHSTGCRGRRPCWWESCRRQQATLCACTLPSSTTCIETVKIIVRPLAQGLSHLRLRVSCRSNRRTLPREVAALLSV